MSWWWAVARLEPGRDRCGQEWRQTLVIEYLHELGGVGTVGLIGSYWYGLRRGYTAYVDEQVNPGRDRWNSVEKAEWLRQELRRSGADIWLVPLVAVR